jgi:Carboxypeptidase regulatory-like domain/PDZ domain
MVVIERSPPGRRPRHGPSARRRAAVAGALLGAALTALVAIVLVARARPGAHPALATVPEERPPPTAQREAQPVEDRTPEIRGRILDADGNLVQGAAVRLVSPVVPYTVLGDTTSDPAGRFSFARVGPGRARVVADHDPGGTVTSAVLRAAEGETTEVTLVLSPFNAVRGTVVDGDDHPVAGATLSIEGVPWRAGAATSGDDGAFRIPTVPDEATSLLAVARGYRTARVTLAPFARRDSELVVRVRLSAASPVDGDVHDVDDRPVRARVVACEGQPSEVRTTSGDDGTFQLPPSTIGCPAVARHDEYAPSDPVDLAEGRRALLRLRMGGSIDGVVVDESGAAVPSFTLGIESFAAAQGRSFRSAAGRKFEDPRGAFRWEGLAPGSYVLVATASDKPPARSDAVEVRGGTATSGVRIVLAHGGSVTGHVYDERHAPLADVDLRFDAVSSAIDTGGGTKTDGAGRYRVDGAPGGLFTLRAHKDGFRVRLLSGLRVDPHRTLTADITLTAVDGGAGIEFGGIGASLAQSGEGISLTAVFPGDPADRTGLRAGDRVVRIDGEETDGLSVADVLQRIRGEPGASVGVTVQRAKTGEIVDVLIPRAIIVR